MSTGMFGRLQKMTAALLAVLMVFGLQLGYASPVENVQVRSAPLKQNSITKDGMVRVYLSSLGNPSTLDLTVKGQYRMSGGMTLSNGTQLRITFSSSTGEIKVALNGQVFSAGKTFSLLRSSASENNGILISQSRDSTNPYPGDMSFEAIHDGRDYTLYVIAHVYIENYLYGVLPYEMGNSSGIEALKAQAVAARTYTVRMMDTRAYGRYDVKDTTSDQVYRGTPSGNANCKAAVDATKGIVLMYGNEYITTFYSASNGGQTEISRNGTSYPYMKVKDDPFDYANPASTVKKKVIYSHLNHASNPQALIALLKNRAVSALKRMGYSTTSGNIQLNGLTNITPHSPMYAAPSRLYTKLDFSYTVTMVNGVGQTDTIALVETIGVFDELESLLDMSIQSGSNELWSVSKQSDSFVLQARRYGHGMGMSQRGAMYMNKLGYSYDQILGFYYDGCTRVKHSFVNTILTTEAGDQEIAVETPAELENNENQGCTGTVTLVNNGGVLAIRSAANHSAKMIGYASNGALVDVLAQNGDWHQIRYGQIIGFVPSSALAVSGVPEGETLPVTDSLGFAMVTAKDFVNLRETGSMSAKVVGTAPAGAVFTVFHQNGQWARIQYNALVAYVNTNYVSNLSSVYPAGEISTGARYARVVPASGQTMAALKATPSANGRVIAELMKGETVKILSDDGSWCRVEYNQLDGYIETQYLQYTDVPSLESEEGSDYKRAIVVTENGSLNMRPRPDANSGVLTTIPKGTEIAAAFFSQTWSRAKYLGYEGFVMNRYLQFLSEDEEENDETLDEEGQTKATVITPGGSLNLRSEPNGSAQIIGRIPQYAVVDVHKQGTEWSVIEFRTKRGFAMNAFLRFENQVPEAAPETDEPDTSEEGEASGFQLATVQTVSGSLNMRREPSQKSSFITAIPQYASVTVIGYGEEWCAVRYAGYEGYVMRRFLKFDHEPEEEENFTQLPEPPETGEETTMWVATSSDGLNMRKSPQGDAAVVITIPRHAQVTAMAEDNGWSYISFKGYMGYVKSKYLSAIRPSEESNISDQAEMFVIVDGLVLDVTLELPGRVAFATTEKLTPVYTMCVESEQTVVEIAEGENVEVLMIGELWCKVDYQGIQGYCLRDRLNVRYE